MATSYSESQIRQLLKQWLPAVNTAGCHFSVVEGLTGESWRIENENIRLLVRQQTPIKQALGVSRRREGRVLKRSGQGIGPRVLLQCNDCLIVEWLEGEKVSENVFSALNASGELAALTAQIHKRPLSGYRLNLQQQFSAYWSQIDRQRMTPAWLTWQHYFMQHKMPNPLMMAPLHMDIHLGNLVIQGDRLRLFDWEYAADGDIALELAALFRFNQFTLHEQRQFLRHYTQQGYADLARLDSQVQRWLPWVDYLMLMWFEVRWQQCRDPAFLRWGAALYQRFCLSSVLPNNQSIQQK
ncbi:phosphotransferase [Serratia sp. UGAL515B_01]|uniref:phosphotransferase n=1 Tax=Serratia sp. UGAL515B_01 TaxID=2986763 RepID=UPI0029534B06|nr:phosphotransferase [Serratia sp. UGAL515B_01]WON78472.1 phosphotransferase [Serratia sp. UGAL515B_01]